MHLESFKKWCSSLQEVLQDKHVIRSVQVETCISSDLDTCINMQTTNAWLHTSTMQAVQNDCCT